YALPALLLAGKLIIDGRVSRTMRLLLLACSLITSVAIFSSANRSGWLGALQIGVMLYAFGRRQIRTALVVAVLAAGTYYLMIHYSSTLAFEHRVNQTLEGYYSDQLRKDLLIHSFQIGLENPILGVGPMRLPYEMATHMRLAVEFVDAHNVFGHVFGGSGLF